MMLEKIKALQGQVKNWNELVIAMYDLFYNEGYKKGYQDAMKEVDDGK